MNTSARLEKALKELQKLPGNKKCADCTGTGALVRACVRPQAGGLPSAACADPPSRVCVRQAPQYVCLNFSTFICTNCATAQCVPRQAGPCTCGCHGFGGGVSHRQLCLPPQPVVEPPGEGIVHEHVHRGGDY